MKDKIKEKWLNLLKPLNSDWEDGDLNNQDKTADLINKNLKLAVELKNDTIFKIKINRISGGSLITLSNRYRGYGRDANQKFLSYPDHKTALLIETQMFKGLLQNVFTGIQVINLNTRKSFLKNKNLWESYPNIGCYIIKSEPENTIPEYYYCHNPVADQCRIIEKEGIDNYLGIKSIFLFSDN